MCEVWRELSGVCEEGRKGRLKDDAASVVEHGIRQNCIQHDTRKDEVREEYNEVGDARLNLEFGCAKLVAQECK